MTNDELRKLIDSDPEASKLAGVGDDTGCAARCSEIAPKGAVDSMLITELTMFNVFPPQEAEKVLQQIELVAKGNPVVARVWKWMLPGSQGVNFAHPAVRGVLTAPTEMGGLGFTAEQVAPLLRAGEVPVGITADRVSEALYAERHTDPAAHDEGNPDHKGDE